MTGKCARRGGSAHAPRSRRRSHRRGIDQVTEDVSGVGTASEAAAETAVGGGRKKKVPGKYTKKGAGHCKYGGWNQDGIERYNCLRRLVKEDRESDEAQASESSFLQYSKERRGEDKNIDDDDNNNDAMKRVTATREPVEPEWDSDDKD